LLLLLSVASCCFHLALLSEEAANLKSKIIAKQSFFASKNKVYSLQSSEENKVLRESVARKTTFFEKTNQRFQVVKIGHLIQFIENLKTIRFYLNIKSWTHIFLFV
jgi:hypothetical protein